MVFDENYVYLAFPNLNGGEIRKYEARRGYHPGTTGCGSCAAPEKCLRDVDGTRCCRAGILIIPGVLGGSLRFIEDELSFCNRLVVD